MLAKDRKFSSVGIIYLVPILKRLANSVCATIGAHTANDKGLGDCRESTTMAQFGELRERKIA
jgi:hypothetical protein